jgi:hypothetical protein
MSECDCFASALQVSEQLHRTETALASTSFDHVLNVARQASVVCRRYASCSQCSDPSYFTIYVIILRKAAACYTHLAQHVVGQGSSPGTTASTGSSAGGSTSSQWSYATTSRLRIGSFEVEAPLDEHTRTIILRTEVRRAAQTAAVLEAVLGPASIKASSRGTDEAALQYQRGLVATLTEDIRNVDKILQLI